MRIENIKKTKEEKEFIRFSAVKMLKKGLMKRREIVKFFDIS